MVPDLTMDVGMDVRRQRNTQKLLERGSASATRMAAFPEDVPMNGGVTNG